MEEDNWQRYGGRKTEGRDADWVTLAMIRSEIRETQISVGFGEDLQYIFQRQNLAVHNRGRFFLLTQHFLHTVVLKLYQDYSNKEVSDVFTSIWEVFGALFTVFLLGLVMAILPYCVVCVRKYLHVCGGQMKKHCLFTLLLPCIGNARRKFYRLKQEELWTGSP